MPVVQPLVSAAWLSTRLASVKIVDASWYLPAAKRDPRAEFAAKRLPHAVFYDIDATDDSSGLPHMLPSAHFFARTMTDIGVANSDHVVCYDGAGIFSAPRLWWLLRAFGHEQVSVLDGGMPAWEAAGLDVDTAAPAPPMAAERFEARLKPELVCTLAQMRENLQRESGGALVVDARSAGRFTGSAPEPREGLRSGHIPGSRSLPSSQLLEDGKMLPVPQLRRAFEEAGVDLTRPLALSCGSGVTASTLALGLAVLGRPDAAVYDGSWSEWGQAHLDTPVETGGDA